jgi:hypothetical protein
VTSDTFPTLGSDAAVSADTGKIEITQDLREASLDRFKELGIADIETTANQNDPEVARIVRAAVTWVDIARKNGYGGEGWIPTAADISHSSLLGRLLAGQEPEPIAPPLSYSYPWVGLNESGAAYFIPESFQEWFETEPDWAIHREGYLSLCQDSGWEIVERLNPGYRLTHSQAPGTWALRPLCDDEDHPQRGTHFNAMSGKPEPILATWVLKRETMENPLSEEMSEAMGDLDLEAGGVGSLSETSAVKTADETAALTTAT